MDPPADTGIALIPSGNESDAINITQFGLSVPATSTPQGFIVNLNGYVSGNCTLFVQMLRNGSPVGDARSIALTPSSPQTFSLGTANDLFGSAWDYSDLNNVNFGIRVYASTSSLSVTVSIGYITLETFVLPDRSISSSSPTLPIRMEGQKYPARRCRQSLGRECHTNAHGILDRGDGKGSLPILIAWRVQGEGVEYLAFEDGTQGTYLPLQYTAGLD